MKRFALVPVMLLAALILVIGAGPALSAEKASDLKPLMGDNFGKMQVILVNMITANYKGLPERIEEIRDHARAISAMSPNSVKTDTDRKMFTNYAFTMERHAENMLTVLRELIKHDQAQASPEVMNIDYLRVVAARHYGELVTTCVLCHNQFRRKSVK